LLQVVSGEASLAVLQALSVGEMQRMVPLRHTPTPPHALPTSKPLSAVPSQSLSTPSHCSGEL
jgi:hypothetical protein